MFIIYGHLQILFGWFEKIFLLDKTFVWSIDCQLSIDFGFGFDFGFDLGFDFELVLVVLSWVYFADDHLQKQEKNSCELFLLCYKVWKVGELVCISLLIQVEHDCSLSEYCHKKLS